jgi:hypothetical protein
MFLIRNKGRNAWAGAVREILMILLQVIEPGWHYDKDLLFHVHDRHLYCPGMSIMHLVSGFDKVHQSRNDTIMVNG